MEQEHSFWNRDCSIRSFDEEDRKEAAKHQTKKQQERGDDAEKRNVRGVESAQFSARQNQYRAAFDSLKDTMQKNLKLKKLRDALENSGLKKNGKTASNQYDDVDLFQTAMGFESFDELAGTEYK